MCWSSGTDGRRNAGTGDLERVVGVLSTPTVNVYLFDSDPSQSCIESGKRVSSDPTHAPTGYILDLFLEETRPWYPRWGGQGSGVSTSTSSGRPDPGPHPSHLCRGLEDPCVYLYEPRMLVEVRGPLPATQLSPPPVSVPRRSRSHTVYAGEPPPPWVYASSVVLPRPLFGRGVS